MKGIKAVLSFVAVFALCIMVPVSVPAAESTTWYSSYSTYSSSSSSSSSPYQTYSVDGSKYYDYYIDGYDVNIVVNEDNTLSVTEKITANFNNAKHGIYRYIPLKNQIEREDESTSTVRAKVKDLAVSEEYTTYRRSGNYVIQIGSQDKTYTGQHEYILSYTYVIGRDGNSDFDELYYNIIGDGWDTTIKNISFEITMPSDFDESLLGFSAGTYGTVGTEAVSYKVKDNVITGTFGDSLSAYQAFTVRVELPEGYFAVDNTTYYLELSLCIVIPLLVLLLVYLLWSKFGRDEKVISAVEFYPPEGMSSAEMAYWVKGKVESDDIVPLMIELANEGYIKINEVLKKNGKPKKNDFSVTKVKDYAGDDENKRIFFDGLFAGGRVTVTKDNLQNKFYIYINQILSRMNTSFHHKEVFSGRSLTLRVLCIVLSVASAVAAVIIGLSLLGGTERYIFIAIGAAIAVVAFILSFFLRQRTKQAHEILQKINGFKMFLKTAEKERLETMVNEDPEYFYDILPYAYVLGVSKEWTEKFESIAMEPPGWYGGGGMFNYLVFSSFMMNTMRFAAIAMVSTPPPQPTTMARGGRGGFGGGFRGGFGGGGFAGGGFGGGGGGSW